jgi:hypothetical protein
LFLQLSWLHFTVLRLSVTRFALLSRIFRLISVLESFRKYVKAERNELVDMDKAELEKFLDYLAKLGEG